MHLIDMKILLKQVEIPYSGYFCQDKFYQLYLLAKILTGECFSHVLMTIVMWQSTVFAKINHARYSYNIW